MKITIREGSCRALRGGSWDFAFVSRMAFRYSYSPDYSHDDCGFRITRRINNENNNKKS